MAHESDAKYDSIIGEAVKLAAASGPLIIVPGLDLAGMAMAWGVMAVEIADENGVQIQKKEAVRMATAVLTGAGAYVASVKLVTAIFAKIPGIGWIIGSGVNSLANVLLTLWFAFALIDLYDGNKGKKSLESCVEFLIDEINPKKNAKKIGRATAFFKRWTR